MLVGEQAKVCQRLVRLVELGFPELGELFEDPTCRTAREVLRMAPTASAAGRRRTATLANANAGAGRRRLGETRARRLQELAADSIAVPELEQKVAFEVGLLLNQFDLLESQIVEADQRVASLLDGELARRLQTIPCVGPAITATLIAEIGDIFRFDDFDQLLAYAGVHPAERSSGNKGANPETSWHMSKAGNAHLRAAAYRMAVVGVQHNPVGAEALGGVEIRQRLGKTVESRSRPGAGQEGAAVGWRVAHQLLGQRCGALVVGDATQDMPAQDEQVDQVSVPGHRKPSNCRLRLETVDLRLQIDQGNDATGCGQFAVVCHVDHRATPLGGADSAATLAFKSGGVGFGRTR